MEGLRDNDASRLHERACTSSHTPQFEAHIVQDRVGEIRLAAGFGWLGFAFERLYVAGKDSSDVT